MNRSNDRIQIGPTITKSDLITDNGNEGPLAVDPPIVYKRIVSRRLGLFWFGIKGHPIRWAERLTSTPVGFRGAAVNIWHEVAGAVWCQNGVGHYKVFLNGSKFPTHTMFEYARKTKNIPQGGINWLWSVHPLDPTRVQ